MQRNPNSGLVSLAAGEVFNQHHIGALAQLQDAQQFSRG